MDLIGVEGEEGTVTNQSVRFFAFPQFLDS